MVGPTIVVIVDPATWAPAENFAEEGGSGLFVFHASPH